MAWKTRKRKSLTDDDLRDVLRAYQENDEVTSDAAKSMDLDRSTFVYRLNKARDAVANGGLQLETKDEVVLPSFPSPDLPTEDIIDSLSDRFERRMAHEESKRFFDIRFPSDDCILVCAIGDPHLGVHTNWKLLKHHTKLLADNSGILPGSEDNGVWAVNIGDSVNNWSHRLMSQYANEDISRETERRLARWWMQDAGLRFCLWLHGNHEHMSDEFLTYLETINAQAVPMVDWRARVRFVFPSTEVKFDFAHNHKGTSIYSKTHGQKRAQLFDTPCDVTVAGHHHLYSIVQEELDDGRNVVMCRVRGYKWLDTWAHRTGFAHMKMGSTVAFFINPKAKGPMKITPFPDLEQGIEYLKFMRSKSNL